MQNTRISIRKLSTRSGEKAILDDINMDIADGEIISIIGPSGGGKSTILRCINGLQEYSGDIKLHGVTTEDIAMVFQNFNLFANMTVLENMLYVPVKIRNKNVNEIKEDAESLLNKFGMLQYINTYPSRLSGGQKQRIAIARALCTKPKVLLVDEPTSALDPENVKGVLDILQDLAKDRIVMIIVTHEIRFAQNISSRMLFVENGSIIVDANTNDFFSSSSMDNRVKDFLQHMVL